MDVESVSNSNTNTNFQNNDELLNYILTEKSKGLELVNAKKFNEAYNIYLNISTLIKNSKLPQDDKLSEVNNQFKLILSNIALCLGKLNRIQESIKYDVKIFIELDKYFEKSYARVIHHYVTQKNFLMANYYASLMKSVFDATILSKHTEMLNKIETEIRKKQTNFSNFM